MKKHVLTIGLDDKNAKRQLIDTNKALEIIRNALLKSGIDGATFTEGRGMYRYNDSTLAWEKTVIVSMYEFDKLLTPSIKVASNLIKHELNQESIAYETTESNSVLL